MTKCTFCVDEIDAGRPPVCVTSCPLRVLEYGEVDGAAQADTKQTQDPLPDPQLTRPALEMREHRDAGRARRESVEVGPKKRHELREWSLVAFTLLAQLAAGTVLVGGIAIASSPSSEFSGGPGWIVAGIAIAVALVLSLRHLGAPRRAVLAACNWRTSWLSREIIAAVSLTVVCATAVALGDGAGGELLLLAGVCAVSLLVSMSGVYMLRTVPTWNSLRTPAAFFATSLVLGSLTNAVLHQAYGGAAVPLRWFLGLAVAALIAGRLIELSGKPAAAATWSVRNLSRVSALGSVALLGIILVAGEDPGILLILASVLALDSEVVARHRFFQSYARTGI